MCFSVNFLEVALPIRDLYEEGLAGTWNALHKPDLQLRSGDKIVSCNGFTGPESMLDCIAQWDTCALKLKVLRGPFPTPTQPSSPRSFSQPIASQFSFFDIPPEAQEREKLRDAELEKKRQASQAEFERRRQETAKVTNTVDKADLQRLIMERLAKSRGM